MEPTEPQSPESAQVPNTQQSATRYDADQIRVLEGMEAVRKRPAMYIGSTGVDGLHHLVYEVVDNCVDEHMAGFGNEIEVVLQVDGSVMVSDKGRGIPTGMHSTQKKSAAEVALTVLHAGGKFEEVASSSFFSLSTKIISAKYTGENFAAGFNARYFLDVFWFSRPL